MHCGRTPKTWPAAGAVKGAECRQDRWVCSARPRIRTIFAPSASNIAFEERSRQSHWAGANGATRLSSKETPSATEPALGKSVPRTSQGYAKRPRSILTCRPPPANQHSATTRQRGTQCSLPVSAPSPALASAIGLAAFGAATGTANAAPTHQPEWGTYTCYDYATQTFYECFDPS